MLGCDNGFETQWGEKKGDQWTGLDAGLDMALEGTSLQRWCWSQPEWWRVWSTIQALHVHGAPGNLPHWHISLWIWLRLKPELWILVTYPLVARTQSLPHKWYMVFMGGVRKREYQVRVCNLWWLSPGALHEVHAWYLHWVCDNVLQAQGEGRWTSFSVLMVCNKGLEQKVRLEIPLCTLWKRNLPEIPTATIQVKDNVFDKSVEWDV
jgi:hypothetical protein